MSSLFDSSYGSAYLFARWLPDGRALHRLVLEWASIPRLFFIAAAPDAPCLLRAVCVLMSPCQCGASMGSFVLSCGPSVNVVLSWGHMLLLTSGFVDSILDSCLSVGLLSLQ
jgi:hypothetical protein